MLVTLLGILIAFNSEQPEKAPHLILVMLLGTVVFLQPESSVFVAVSMMALQLLRES